MRASKLLAVVSTILVAAASATAQTTFESGVLRHQYWTSDNPNGVQHPTRAQVENGQAGLPATDTTDLAIWEASFGGIADLYRKISGLFVAPVTTNYVFWVNSDDDSDFFYQYGCQPFNKRFDFPGTGWSNLDRWHATGSGGGSIAAQTRSDQFSPDGGASIPFKNGIPLVAGKKYGSKASISKAAAAITSPSPILI